MTPFFLSKLRWADYIVQGVECVIAGWRRQRVSMPEDASLAHCSLGVRHRASIRRWLIEARRENGLRI
jgi:hypothetical protein